MNVSTILLNVYQKQTCHFASLCILFSKSLSPPTYTLHLHDSMILTLATAGYVSTLSCWCLCKLNLNEFFSIFCSVFLYWAEHWDTFLFCITWMCGCNIYWAGNVHGWHPLVLREASLALWTGLDLMCQYKSVTQSTGSIITKTSPMRNVSARWVCPIGLSLL